MFHSTIISLLEEELMKVLYAKYMLQMSDFFLSPKQLPDKSLLETPYCKDIFKLFI